jgi:DNA polymerase
VIELEQLKNEYSSCEICNLCPSKTGINGVVKSSGPVSSIAIIGEAPGSDEDISGEPFVGRAGRMLDKLLQGAKIKRSQVFITNTVKCRPTQNEGKKNRTPTVDECESCRPWLYKELEIVKPKVIVTLGKISTESVLALPKNFTLGEYVNKSHETHLRKEDSDEIITNMYTVVPCWHPSYLMQHGRGKFDEAVECFKLAKKLVLK